MAVFQPRISLRPRDVIGCAALQRPGLAGRRIAGLVPDLLDQVRADSLLRPEFIYEIRPVKAVVAGDILLQDNTALHAPLVAQKLPQLQHLAVGICTIGARLEDRVARLFAARKGLAALVLDEIGNAAVRLTARRAHARIRAEARQMKLDASSALCPGSTGFEQTCQTELCRLAGADRIGVTLPRGAMMQPGKSMSFVIGLGRDMPRWSQAEDCRNCRAADRCRDRVAA
jgi:cobalamin-dependent methionine synthase I